MEIGARHPDGSPSVVHLGEEQQVVDGFACTWWMHLHPNGRLEYGVLAAPATLAGFSLVAGDKISLSQTGTPELIHFDEPRAVLGQTDVSSVGFDAEGAVKELAIGDTVLDPRGRVRRHYDLAATTIEGIPCTGETSFDEQGRVESTELAEDYPSRVGVVPAGSYVRFVDGDLASASVARSCVLGGVAFEARESAYVSAEGVRKGPPSFAAPALPPEE